MDDEAPADVSRTIARFAVCSAAAGLIPVPIVVLVALAGLQLQLLRRLSTHQGVPFSGHVIRSIAASLAGSVIAVQIGQGVLTSLARGLPLGGFLAVLALPLAAAAATWTLGRTALRLWLAAPPRAAPPPG